MLLPKETLGAHDRACFNNLTLIVIIFLGKDETGFPGLPQRGRYGLPGPEKSTAQVEGMQEPTGLPPSISTRIELAGEGTAALFQRIQPAFRASGIWSVCGLVSSLSCPWLLHSR